MGGRAWWVVAAALAGCVVEEEGDDLPGGGSLSGTWELPAYVWTTGSRDRLAAVSPCAIEIAGSRGSVDCEHEAEDTEWVYDEDTDEEREVSFPTVTRLTSSLTVQETLISAEGTWTVESRMPGYEHTCTIEFRGSAGRKEGRTSEGRFSAIAGVWEGAVNADIHCVSQNGRGGGWSDSAGWRVAADLFGEQGTVTIQPLSGEHFEEWTFLNTPQGLQLSQRYDDYGRHLVPEVQ